MSGFGWHDDADTWQAARRSTRRKLAETYTPDAALDRLIEAIERDFSLDGQLSPHMRLTLGGYKAAKAAYLAEVTENGLPEGGFR